MPELLHPGVYVREISSGVRPIEGVSTSTAAFIGIADKGPIPGGSTPTTKKLPNGRAAQPEMVTSLTEYFRKFGGFRKDSFLTYAVQAFYENGGRRAYIVRVVPKDTQTPEPDFKPAKCAEATFDDLQVSAANEGAWGNRIWIKIDPSTDRDVNRFKLIVLYGSKVEDLRPAVVETFDDVDRRINESAFVATVVNSRSEYIAIKNTADLATVPTTIKFTTNDKGEANNQAARLGHDDAGRGDDGSPNRLVDFAGSAATDSDSDVTGSGLHALDKITDVNLITIPGRGDLANKGVEYCKFKRPLQDCFFIGDVGTIQDVNSARVIGANTDDGGQIQKAVDFAKNFTSKAAGDYGAVYYPWILSTDPIGSGSNPRILLPPSGFLAGIYARVDNSRGVFKAPAGTTDSGVAGALALATPVSDTEQDRLNPIGVNVVRVAPAGGGIVVWGTRTIGSDAEWRYIPVRRMAIFLRVSIYFGIQWAVFEPNDEPLWASLRLNIRSFMLTQFRAGAFQGKTPNDAFFVKCDSSTTTQTDIDNGVVNILVGFAPLKPAEFVVLTLQQKVNQPTA